MTRISPRGRAAALAVLLGALVAAVVPTSSAVAFLSSPQTWKVQVQSPATLQARGVAVSVPVTVTCPADGSFAGLSVTVTQRAGRQSVSGSRFQDLRCTGAEQVVTVNVLTQSGQVFKKGTAFAEAVLSGCGYVCGTMATDSRTISITR